MQDKMKALAKRLKAEQRQLIIDAANLTMMPSLSTNQRVAMLELNIAAIENTIEDEK